MRERGGEEELRNEERCKRHINLVQNLDLVWISIHFKCDNDVVIIFQKESLCFRERYILKFCS